MHNEERFELQLRGVEGRLEGHLCFAVPVYGWLGKLTGNPRAESPETQTCQRQVAVRRM